MPNPIQSKHQIQNQDKPRNEPSSGGYSRSPSPVNVEEVNIENIKEALKPNAKKLSSPLKEKDLSRKEIPSTPHVPIQPGTNRDLLKVISETKAGSEQVVSNSENKSIQQEHKPIHEEKEKEGTPIQKARTKSMDNTILKSVAEKMIQIMNQPLKCLQKDAYWNNELVVVTSCLVEQTFPDEYREQISCFGKIFENLFHSQENLSNICLKTALVKENCESIDTAVTTLRERDAVYEKHLIDANAALNDLSKERDELTKKLTEIQAQIQEIDNKTMKLKKPFEKIQEKKLEIKEKLSAFEQIKQQNEEELKNLQ
ncbi:hypothetical protein PIB30_032010 [Stylosanthes scabra]|uniref:Uncharacterized protein n=1 Tax=Stylosanthes scabra TaxID=79078 RepID=A0ABU6WD13_9FABA|nr:hypothetical protein [Stylosanthes scabra]